VLGQTLFISFIFRLEYNFDALKPKVYAVQFGKKELQKIHVITYITCESVFLLNALQDSTAFEII
jgi:hypothetical protein